MSGLLLAACIVTLPLLLVALCSWRAYLCVAGVLNVLLIGLASLAMWQMRQPEFDDSVGAGFGLMMLTCAELVVALASSVAAALAALLRCLPAIRRAHATARSCSDRIDPPCAWDH